MHANNHNEAHLGHEEELARLRELATRNAQQLEALHRELRIVRTERDLLK